MFVNLGLNKDNQLCELPCNASNPDDRLICAYSISRYSKQVLSQPKKSEKVHTPNQNQTHLQQQFYLGLDDFLITIFE